MVTQLLPSSADYTAVRRSWRGDLIAGVTVGVVALPLALAFGISSGVGAAAGLITAVVAGVVAAVFGGSNVQVSGPTGAMVVVLAPIVTHFGLGSVALVTVMAGVVVGVAGVTGLGRLVTLIPWPVMEGFTVGIAVIIFLQQVPAALGEAVPRGQSPLLAAAHVAAAADIGRAGPALLVVLTVVVLMVVLPRLHTALPASLLAIAVTTGLALVPGFTVARIGALPSHLPTPVWPAADLATMRPLLGAALVIAILAAIESLLSARVAATMSPTGTYDPDRELIGQGLASVASAMFGGMPATGAIARTAVNVRSGAQTRIAAIVHAILLLAVVYLGSAVVATIPLAALAAVLMVTSCRMVSPRMVSTILRSTRSDALTFVLTAVVTVGVDLIEAVGIGITVTAAFALHSLARRSRVVREDLPGPYHQGDERIALLRLDGAMFFGAAERLSLGLGHAHHPDVTVVIIRMSRLGLLDATGAHALSQIVKELESRSITVIIKGIQPEHRTLLTTVGTIKSLRHANHVIDSLDDAVAHARTHVDDQFARELTPTELLPDD